MSTRTAVLWVPDWPVVAAAQAAGVEPHVPAAVHDGRRVLAVSAPARAAGVRAGTRRRTAQGVCPELVLLPADEDRDAVLFETVARAAEEVVPGVEVVRPGLLLVPAAGAARYHGSAEALAERLVVAVLRAGHESQVGVADGLLAAVLAAREQRVLPPGESPSFLAPFPVSALVHAAAEERARSAVRGLVDLLVRLGLRRLGDLAALPAQDVATRFGELGAWAHRLARGEDPRPPVRRRPEPDLEASCALDPPVERLDVATFAARRLAEELHALLVARSASCSRLEVLARTEGGQELRRTWRTDLGGLGGLTPARITDRVRWQLEGWLARPEEERGPLVHLAVAAREVSPAGAEQGRLWGGASGGDLRAHRALDRVQGLLGSDAVLAPRLQGGRGPRDRVHLAPWGTVSRDLRPLDRPWSGRLPPPAPATVPPEPEPVGVLDASGRPVRVDGRWALSAGPARLRWEDGREALVGSWAGPWPLLERWWAGEGAVVHLQAALDDGLGVLLAWRGGRWLCEARYD